MLKSRMSVLLVGLTVVAFLVLTSSTTSANTVVDDVSITVPASCNLSSGATVDVAHTANINNGMYKEDIGTTTFKVFCNDNNGFSVYAIGYANEEFGNTDMIATVGGAVSPAYNIPTGLALSGDTSNWAMKLTKVAGTYEPTILSDINGSFADYHVVPTDYTKVATLASNTDFTNGSSFTTTYRAYVSNRQPAGTYVGKVRYAIVHPNDGAAPKIPRVCPANTICYDDNGANSPTKMGDQTVSSGATTINLWPSNFQRAGYGFAGWNTKADGTGTKYGPMETITLPSDFATNGLNLYAMWIPSAGNIQGWTGCSSLAAGAVTALTDARDNNVYAVAKLADGKCWMIENLRLGGTATTTLTPTDSNVSSSFTLSASTNPTTTAWCTTSSAACDDQSMLNSNNTTNPVANMTTPSLGSSDNTGIYSLGNYYNWYSATAGTGTYSTSTGNTSVASSVCPSGWHLPKGGNSSNSTNSEFWKLGTAIMGFAPSNNSYYQNTETNTAGKTATAAIRSYPNNFIYSGYLNGSSFNDRGSGGYYWSSTVSSSNSTYRLRFDTLSVYPGTDTILKYYGLSIRCVTGS